MRPITNPVGQAVEKWLFGGLLALFLTPLTLSLIHRSWPGILPNSPWLRNESLEGVVVKPPHVTLSWSTLRTGQYQASLAHQFNSNFAARELLIRLTCESWYRLFRQSPLTSGIVLGKEDCLFTDYHLAKYCLLRTSTAQLEPMVTKLRSLQEACDKVGTPFTVLITPSKASIQPENIPSPWLQRYDPRPRAYDQFVPLLTKHGVRFVDGRALTLEIKAHEPAPVFPKGGIHWGSPSAFATAQALITALQSRDKPLKPLEHETLSLSNSPKGDDADLVRLMNLARPWRYPVANLQVKPAEKLPGNPGFNATFIGGSFTTAVAEQLSASGQFSEVDAFFYYKQDKRCFVKGQLHSLKSPVPQVDFDREIFASDFLIMEINESFLDFTDQRYTNTFIDDALNHLESWNGNRLPFLREGEQHMAYQPGHKISFRADDHPFGHARDCLSGFADCETGATWTQGPIATLRLSLPPPKHDLRLDATVGAFIHLPQLPAQIIQVHANDQWVGEWKFTDPGETRRQAIIPKEFVDPNGKLTLRFDIANPTSPASLGIGDDHRKLGIWFSKLKLSDYHQGR
ncbi:MAG: hypothetical protein QE274_15015 [Verrucomicrobiaceae bacterium]|jgi:hypothetical protein|nr:hypothetical protein [Verrucomicrobiaceae bacterium]